MRVKWHLSQVIVAAAVCVVSLPHMARGQSERILSPSKVLSLVNSVPDAWHSGLRPSSMLANGQRLYVLMLPVTNSGTYSSLVVISEDGSLVTAQQLSRNMRPTFGADHAGNIIMFRQDSKNEGVIETHSADGTLLAESSVTGSPEMVRTSELGIKIFRNSKATRAVPSANHRTVEALSQQRVRNHQHYVDALLDNKRIVHFYLSRPQVTVSDATGAIVADRVIGRTVLDHYSSVVQSSDPHVSYPELYSAVVSPEGSLFALVGNTKLAQGAIAVQVEPEAGTISLVLRLLLPTVAGAKNPDNVEGYLVPTDIAISENCVFVLDKGTGVLALYGGRF